MEGQRTVWFILLMCLVNPPVDALICPYDGCICYSMSSKVTSICIGLAGPKLHLNPSHHPVDDLLITSDNVTEISKEDLPSGLSELTIEMPLLHTLSDDVFDNSATSLKTLRINAADFPALPNALYNLNILDSLTITVQNLTWNETILAKLAKKLTGFVVRSDSFTSNFLNQDNFDKLELFEWSLTKSENSIFTHDPFPPVISRFNRLKELNMKGFNLGGVTDFDAAFGNTVQTLKELIFYRCAWPAHYDFSNFKNLDTLYLTENSNLTVIPSAMPVSLTHLTCQRSNLKTFPSFINSPRPALTFIDFSENNITYLGANFSKGLDNLEAIFLDHNQISGINDNAFVHMDALYLFSVDWNKLKEVPKALARIPGKYVSIDLSENPIACPCTPRELHDWANDLPHPEDNFKLPATCVGGQSGVSVWDTLLSDDNVCNEDIVG